MFSMRFRYNMKISVGFLCLALVLSRAVAVNLEVAETSALLHLIVAAALGWMLLQILRRQGRRECYLVDFTCFKPPAEREANTELSIYFSARTEPIIPDKLGFQWRIYLRSGLGDETAVSSFFFNQEMVATLEEARIEVEECLIAAADELFAKTQVTPQDIDIVIVTVSTFTPAPSHASMIVNHYKMKEKVKTFSLSGMGCSANVIAVDMAKDMFVSYPDCYALVLATESLTMNANYPGNDKTFMLTNCLFRVGGNALLLSNKPQEAERAKMRLLHTVRTNLAADDEAYDCVMMKEDDDGVLGTGLRPSLLHVAAKAMTKNLTALGPKVLPLREKLRYAYNMLCIKVFKMKVEPYVPNFKLAFQHFCIHPGGRSVITGIGKSLKLTDYDLEPSRMALYRFGNTSTSGVWYEVAYMEGKRRLKVGERVLQIALGSGFKCNTAVWEVLRETHPLERNCWDDCLHRHPCSTRKNYTDDFCDQWFHRLNPISNDMCTTSK